MQARDLTMKARHLVQSAGSALLLYRSLVMELPDSPEKIHDRLQKATEQDVLRRLIRPRRRWSGVVMADRFELDLSDRGGRSSFHLHVSGTVVPIPSGSRVTVVLRPNLITLMMIGLIWPVLLILYFTTLGAHGFDAQDLSILGLPALLHLSLSTMFWSHVGWNTRVAEVLISGRD